MASNPDQNHQPLVSVIVPLYNHERYIIECLESVKNCGYPNLELIVIDDGSKDNSYSLALDWEQANRSAFKNLILESKQNEGIVKTLNHAIQKSSGKFITTLASDDTLLQGGVEVRLAAMARQPKCKAVIGDCIVISEDSEKIHDSGISDLHGGNRSALRDARFIVTELLLRWTVPGPVLLAHADVFDPIRGIGPYREGLRTEDRDFYLRLLSRDWLRYVDTPVAAYRVHGDNYSSNRSAKTAMDFVVSESSGVNNFQGFNKCILALRSQYYHWKLKRRERAPFWIFYCMGEMALWLVFSALAAGFSLLVWATHSFGSNSNAEGSSSI